jgi:putative GTP pyrophosphokinase
MAESKMRVNRAGDYLAAVLRGDEPFDGDRFVAEATVMIAWRREHAYPLNLCVPGLRNWVERESSLDITPVQRLKRAPRIVEKLVRHPEMKLARMQDIGGTRAILGKPAEVEAVARQIRRHWQVSREADYRDTPRPDTGYRVARHGRQA